MHIDSKFPENKNKNKIVHDVTGHCALWTLGGVNVKFQTSSSKDFQNQGIKKRYLMILSVLWCIALLIFPPPP